MNLLEKIITSLSGKMTTPEIFGWFHLMFLAIMVLFTVFMGIMFKNASSKKIRIVVLVYAIVSILLEIYKQLVYSFNPLTGQWSYQWYAFPFQFCSTPMYIALIAGVIKKGKVQDSLYSFLTTFGLIAGLSVMLYPGDVFVSTIGINLQTMIHHAGQVFIGLFLVASKAVKVDLKTPLRALPTFLSLIAVAFVLNISLISVVNGQTFNMFFISPYFPSTLPVFSIIYDKVPYVIFLLTYIFAFLLGSYLFILVILGVKKLFNIIKNVFTKNKKSDI